jgi:hypothetical protein
MIAFGSLLWFVDKPGWNLTKQRKGVRSSLVEHRIADPLDSRFHSDLLLFVSSTVWEIADPWEAIMNWVCHPDA